VPLFDKETTLDAIKRAKRGKRKAVPAARHRKQSMKKQKQNEENFMKRLRKPLLF